MALDDTERAYIREVATNTAGVVSKQVITDVLKWHIDSCPHGKSILASKWGLIGLCLGSGVGGGGIATVLIKLFAG